MFLGASVMGVVSSDFHFIWQGPRSQFVFLPTDDTQEYQNIWSIN